MYDYSDYHLMSHRHGRDSIDDGSGGSDTGSSDDGGDGGGGD